MPFSDYLAKEILKWHRGTAGFPSAPASTFISIHSADPGVLGTSSDLTSTVIGASRPSVAGAVWRLPAATNLAVGGFQITNETAVTLSSSAINANPQQITHFGLWTAATGGNFLNYGLLATPVQIVNGDVVRFGVDQLVIRLI